MIDQAQQIIEDYLNLVKMHLPEEIADEVISELRIYIVEAATEMGQGSLSVESAKKAVARFGAPSQVAEEYKSSMILETSDMAEIEETPDQYMLEELGTYQESVEVGQDLDKRPAVKQEYYHKVAHYREAFVQAIIITLSYSMLSVFGGAPGIVIFMSCMILAGFCFTMYFLYIMGKGRVLLKQDTTEWSRIQKFFTFPLNTFDDPPRRFLRLDLLTSTLGVGIFAIGSLSMMFFVPGILLVGLLSVRLYCLYMRWQNIDPARFQRVEFAFQIITLAAFNFTIGYIMMVPWYFLTIPYYAVVMYYAFLYGFYLLILLTIRSQDLWWEVVLPAPPVTLRRHTKEPARLSRDFEKPTNQEPQPNLTTQLPDLSEDMLSRQIAVTSQSKLQEGPETVVTQKPMTTAEQQSGQDLTTELVKKVKSGAKYILTRMTAYLLTIIAILVFIIPVAYFEVHHWYFPIFGNVLLLMLIMFMCLGLFVSGVYLHVRRYLIRSRKRKTVIGRRKRLESIIDCIVTAASAIIAVFMLTGIIGSLTNLWFWGSEISPRLAFLLVILTIPTFFFLTVGLSIRLAADIADIRSPDSHFALRNLSLSGTLLLFGISGLLGIFLVAFELHGGFVWDAVLLFSTIAGFISFQKATSKYKIKEYWPARDKQETSLEKSKIEIEPSVSAPMKVAVIAMRTVSHMIIWLLAIAIIASIIALLTLVDVYIIGKLINDLYIASIFIVLACLPYFGVRYLLVTRKGYSNIGRRTRGEALLDAIVVFPFCMVFLLKLQYYLNPYYLNQWYTHWINVLPSIVATMTLTIRIIAMLTLTGGLMMRLASNILGLIESGHEKTLGTSLTSSLLLTIAIGIILGHDIGIIPESQKLLAGVNNWEFILIAILALITFQMITTRIKLGELDKRTVVSPVTVQHENSISVVQ